MKRRELLIGGALGALVGAGEPAAAAGSGEQSAVSASEQILERVVRAIGELRDELREEREFTEIASIRSAQKGHLRSNSKLPDFIEVGADVWFLAHDWHVRWQVPLEQSRDAQGRLTLAINGTLVVLRPDVPANFVGLPYDAR